jgi:hypothetical protein
VNEKKIFPNTKLVEIRFHLPEDKAQALRTLARVNGLAGSDYVRSLTLAHLSKLERAAS